MVYEIWDLESGNAVGDYESQESALTEIRDMVRVHGVEAMLPWALERHEGDNIVPIAQGERLIAMALAIVERAAGISGLTDPTSQPVPSIPPTGPSNSVEPPDAPANTPAALGRDLESDGDDDDDMALGLAASVDDDSLARGMPMTEWNALVERYVHPTASSDEELRSILAEVPPERRAWFGTIARVKLHDQDVAGNPFNQGEVVRVTTEDDPITRAGNLLELNERKRRLIRGW